MRQSIQFDDGIWTIEGDQLHLDIPKLLKKLGIPDTDENRHLATQVALQVLRQFTPIGTIISSRVHPLPPAIPGDSEIERQP
ncbi:unnamed protein product [marine sediment metagenome]|uniref:Uncharacterized protein n=1 Tax=marine sediment metagenome TaxID=412755 RepID=X1N4Q8_9ZZZZ